MITATWCFHCRYPLYMMLDNVSGWGTWYLNLSVACVYGVQHVLVYCVWQSQWPRYIVFDTVTCLGIWCLTLSVASVYGVWHCQWPQFMVFDTFRDLVCDVWHLSVAFVCDLWHCLYLYTFYWVNYEINENTSAYKWFRFNSNYKKPLTSSEFL